MIQPLVVVVAPVINLSGSEDFDTQQLTDIIASELLTFPDLAVVPVNLSLAALLRDGKSRIETPADAVELARQFSADATLVAAITEYDPYDPPTLGIIVQWYEPAAHSLVAAPHSPTGGPAAAPPGDDPPGGHAAVSPRLQVQRTFNAADRQTLDDLRQFAESRPGHRSPHDWRLYAKSQELYARYCCWASIRTMLRQKSLRHLSSARGESEP